MREKQQQHTEARSRTAAAGNKQSAASLASTRSKSRQRHSITGVHAAAAAGALDGSHHCTVGALLLEKICRGSRLHLTRCRRSGQTVRSTLTRGAGPPRPLSDSAKVNAVYIIEVGAGFGLNLLRASSIEMKVAEPVSNECFHACACCYRKKTPRAKSQTRHSSV